MKKIKLDKNKVLSFVMLNVLGNFLYAFGIVAFCKPNNLITGGTTGISLALARLLSTNVSYFQYAFNLLFFLLGFFVLGKKFAFSTIVSSILCPTFMLILESFSFNYFILKDPLLATLATGLFMGVGIGLIIRSGSSTGGIDVVVLIMNKYLRLPIGIGLTMCDAILLGAQLFDANVTINLFLYGILMIVIYSTIIDRVVLYGNDKIEIKILTKDNEKMSNMILNDLDRGLTYLHAKTGYLGDEIDYILTVVELRELPKTKKKIYEIDPEAFVVISNVNEVSGRGFSMAKVYHKEKK